LSCPIVVGTQNSGLFSLIYEPDSRFETSEATSLRGRQTLLLLALGGLPGVRLRRPISGGMMLAMPMSWRDGQLVVAFGVVAGVEHRLEPAVGHAPPGVEQQRLELRVVAPAARGGTRSSG
jgi:hypothetical protein